MSCSPSATCIDGWRTACCRLWLYCGSDRVYDIPLSSVSVTTYSTGIVITSPCLVTKRDGNVLVDGFIDLSNEAMLLILNEDTDEPLTLADIDAAVETCCGGAP